MTKKRTPRPIVVTSALRFADLADDPDSRIPISLADTGEGSRRWYFSSIVVQPPPTWLMQFDQALGVGKSLTKLTKAGCNRDKLRAAVYLYCNPEVPYFDLFSKFRRHFREAQQISINLIRQLRALSETLEIANEYRILRTILDDARLESNVRFLQAIRPNQVPEKAVHVLPRFTSLEGRVHDHLLELESGKFNLRRHSSTAGQRRLDVLLVELTLYVESRTGRKHHEELAQLLTAGHRAFGSDKEEVDGVFVKKTCHRFQSRYPEMWYPMLTFWSTRGRKK